MPRPDLSRVPEYFHRYISRVEEDELLPALKNQAATFMQFLKTIPADKKDYCYGEDKWTIKEVLQHIIDAERIFAYRALCIARKEEIPLPGFDENGYAANAKAGNRDWQEILEEFNVVRQSNILLFSSFDDEQLNSSGTASGKPVYVSDIGFIMAGHVNHHKKIMEERYGV